MAVFLVEGPAYRLVELLDGGQSLLGNMSHDGVNDFTLVVTLFAADDILGGDSALGQIDITFLLVDTENDDDFVATDSNKLLDTSDAPSGKFRKQDHSVDVVVLEQLNVSTHIGDLVPVSMGSSPCRSFQRTGRTCLTLTMTKESISGYFSS